MTFIDFEKKRERERGGDLQWQARSEVTLGWEYRACIFSTNKEILNSLHLHYRSCWVGGGRGTFQYYHYRTRVVTKSINLYLLRVITQQFLSHKNIWLASGINGITIRQDTPRFYTHRYSIVAGAASCVFYKTTLVKKITGDLRLHFLTANWSIVSVSSNTFKTR